jgi:hypothetical protein
MHLLTSTGQGVAKVRLLYSVLCEVFLVVLGFEVGFGLQALYHLGHAPRP